MKVNKFRDELFCHLDNVLHPTLLREGKIPEEKLFPVGPITEYVGHLVNLAVRHLQNGEIHLQIGENCRRSLTYALHNNLEKRHVLFANFPSGEREEFMNWMQNHEYHKHVQVLQGDPLELLASKPSVLPAKVGVLYYHGLPNYEAVKLTLRLIEPVLADRAVLIINDTNWGEPNQACQEWVEETANAEVLFHLPTFDNRYPTWWNGLQVLAYRRGWKSIFDMVWRVFG